MAKKKIAQPSRSNEEVRGLLLQYFYDRNQNATSARGKKGSSVKISDVKKELKASHELTQQEVQRNLTYLLSEQWVNEEKIEKSYRTPTGTLVPSTTNFYKITAASIDKIEGPGEFTMEKQHAIKIEATRRNIITVGDGNTVKVNFGNVTNALSELKEAIAASPASEEDKLNYVTDIETIQSQLAKPTPNKSIIEAAWNFIKGAASINGCVTLLDKVKASIEKIIS